jgi:hypothetical protein
MVTVHLDDFVCVIGGNYDTVVMVVVVHTSRFSTDAHACEIEYLSNVHSPPFDFCLSVRSLLQKLFVETARHIVLERKGVHSFDFLFWLWPFF